MSLQSQVSMSGQHLQVSMSSGQVEVKKIDEDGEREERIKKLKEDQERIRRINEEQERCLR